MKKFTPLLLGLGITLVVLGGILSSSPKNVGAATTVPLGKNGTSQYLLYPTDTLSAYTFIATSTTASSSFANGINLTGGCFAIGSVCLPTVTSLSSYLSLSSWYATTTDGLDEGLLNKYFSNSLVDTWFSVQPLGMFWSTTSADHWYTLQNKASTTLLGDANTWSATNQFAKLTFTNATGTSIFVTASSTIGGGTQATGLTINGGATTSGNMYIAGNTGIGIANPLSKLDIRSINVSTGSTVNGQLNIGTTDAQNVDVGGSLTLGGFNDNGASAYRNFASLEGRKENNTTGSSNGYLAFRTDLSGGLGEKMRISSAGNVGIGTTSPYAKLSVVGETVSAYFTATTTTATSSFAGTFYTTGDTFWGGVGKKAYVKVGTNQPFGTSTLASGTVTVKNTQTRADSLIQLTNCVAGGTLGSLSVGTRVANTSFVINSTNILDTSTVCYEIKQPVY